MYVYIVMILRVIITEIEYVLLHVLHAYKLSVLNSSKRTLYTQTHTYIMVYLSLKFSERVQPGDVGNRQQSRHK